MFHPDCSHPALLRSNRPQGYCDVQMGSSGSKNAASASKVAQHTARNAARSSAPGQSAPMPASQQGARNINIKGEPVASSSETKNKAVLRDASDPSAPGPDLLSRNLASLGQASAQKHNSSRFTPVSIDRCLIRPIPSDYTLMWCRTQELLECCNAAQSLKKPKARQPPPFPLVSAIN